MIETEAHKAMTAAVLKGMSDKEREYAKSFAKMLTLIKEIETTVKHMDGLVYDRSK